jgi:hypothetical protein
MKDSGMIPAYNCMVQVNQEQQQIVWDTIPKDVSGARNGIQQMQANATGLHTRRYRTVRVVRARTTVFSINISYNSGGGG